MFYPVHSPDTPKCIRISGMVYLYDLTILRKGHRLPEVSSKIEMSHLM